VGVSQKREESDQSVRINETSDKENDEASSSKRRYWKKALHM